MKWVPPRPVFAFIDINFCNNLCRRVHPPGQASRVAIFFRAAARLVLLRISCLQPTHARATSAYLRSSPLKRKPLSVLSNLA